MSYEEKYKPSKLEEIEENKYQINYIKKWIMTYTQTTQFLSDNCLLKEKTKGRKKKFVNDNLEEIELSKRKGNLMIVGPHSSGKTLIIDLLCKELNYEMINLNNYVNEELNINLIKKIIKPDYFYENSNNNKIIIIDGYEKIISNNKKKEILNITKDNNFLRLLPIIIISNNVHTPNLVNLKKNVNLIEIYNLNIDSIKKLMNNICYNENINIKYKLFDVIIRTYKYDIRKILFNLEILKIINDDNIITIKEIEYTLLILKNKDITGSLFEIVKDIMTNCYNIIKYIDIFKIYKNILSLTLYENYYNFCYSTHYKEIINNFKLSDLIENYIHSEQNWDLNVLHSLIGCAIPAYYISNNYNGSTNTIIYPNDMYKTTIKKKNNKKNDKIINNNNVYCFNNKSVEELIYLNDLI